MGQAAFIAGDWGTSRARLALCDSNGAVLDSREGPGAAATAGRFGETFDALTGAWTKQQGELPALLCGMVGSSFGWTSVPYQSCPAAPERIADACAPLRDGRVLIVPGLACRNRFDAPDFLRGEETQALGALRLDESLRRGRRLLCHPGTHTKWVVLHEGEVREFLSAPTGEVYALLRDQSVLVRKPAADSSPFDSASFARALGHFNAAPRAQLLHRLFECRARQLSGELSPAGADAYLSGLLIASDVHGALDAAVRPEAAEPVALIGAPALTRLYAKALAAQGCGTLQIDGDAAVLAGLAFIHRRVLRSEAAHAQ